MKIHNISIRNFKSIRQLDDFELRSINVLIGSNGAGKSNFISFFKFLNQVVNQSLENYTAKKGGADTFLYFGKKMSPFLGLKIVFENEKGLLNDYFITLEPSNDEKFIVKQEAARFKTIDNKWHIDQKLTKEIMEYTNQGGVIINYYF